MDREERIALWNVHDGVPLYVGGQRVVNVVGRVRQATEVRRLTYSLNGAAGVPVFFRCGGRRAARQSFEGDFNIDTIDRDRLRADNTLVLWAELADGRRDERVVRFPACFDSMNDRRLSERLAEATSAEQVGQVVDGRWRVSRDEKGQRCLQIGEGDAGYDRIILLTDDRLDSGYRITARLRVTGWRGSPYNVGLVFTWNPHRQGDGTDLPSEWSTGLGYFYSEGPGLRVRVGVGVHKDEHGRKVGDHVLGEATYRWWRYWARKGARKFLGIKNIVSQLSVGRDYVFELVVGRERYSLAVWEAGKRRPGAQIVVDDPPVLLARGAAGIIALNGGVRVFEFECVDM